MQTRCRNVSEGERGAGGGLRQCSVIRARGHEAEGAARVTTVYKSEREIGESGP